LAPLHALRQTLAPTPAAPIARVATLEASNYMKNQLLRDADWAGMAHSIEVRTPLVDIELLRKLAPLTPLFGQGAGKRALAQAPRMPLPQPIAARAKTGFTVPLDRWMAAAAKSPIATRGETSRAWSQQVYAKTAAHALNGAQALAV
jgi:asparagine synthase (glutamine-hydrolysing)